MCRTRKRAAAGVGVGLRWPRAVRGESHYCPVVSGLFGQDPGGRRARGSQGGSCARCGGAPEPGGCPGADGDELPGAREPAATILWAGCSRHAPVVGAGRPEGSRGAAGRGALACRGWWSRRAGRNWLRAFRLSALASVRAGRAMVLPERVVELAKWMARVTTSVRWGWCLCRWCRRR